MSASKAVKAHGFKSLKEIAELTGWSTDVLHIWYKKNPDRFNLVLLGCVEFKKIDKDD